MRTFCGLRLRAAFLCLLVVLLSGCAGGSGSGGGGDKSNPAPTLNSISPSSATSGAAAFTLTATGANFISSSTVTWNGVGLVTTYVSETALQAKVTASQVASVGTAKVAVQSPSPGGGTSAAVTFTVDPAPNPVPALSSITPQTANAGDDTLTITVTGAQFIATSQVLWDGTPLSTTWESATSLQAQVPASDLASAGTAQVTVENPAPGGGTSASATFTIRAPGAYLNVLDLPGNDAVWDSVHNLIYVSVPAAASSNGQTIATIDPVSGKIVATQALASEASSLAISDDASYLYAAVAGGTTVQRFTLPNLAADIQFSLGTDFFGAANLVLDMKVAPAAPRTLAVAFAASGVDTGVGVFDDAVARPAEPGCSVYCGAITWSPDAGGLFVEDTLSSELALQVFTVDASGAQQSRAYGGAFRSMLLGSAHLQMDPATGHLYSDGGEIVNSKTGLPVGNLAQLHTGYERFGGAPRVAIDPAQNRIFALTEFRAGSGTVFQAESYDMAHLNLIDTIQIPNVKGTPTNFFRWGKAGLALITATGGTGQLYLIDGSLVNPGGPADTASGTALEIVPSLSVVTPASATLGGSSVNVTVTGRGFDEQTVLNWNGAALPTTFVSATQLRANLPGTALATSTLASITAANRAGQASNALSFSVNPAPASGTTVDVYDVGGNDIIWDGKAAKLYVSVPGIQGDLGNSIAIVDPVAGTITSTGFMGSDPYHLAISSDGSYLYAGFNGNNSVEQLNLPGFAVNHRWNLGADSFEGPFYALDLAAAPGAPHTTAVTTAAFDVSPSGWGVEIFDDAVKRPTTLPDGYYTPVGLQWGGTDATLYAEDQGQPTAFLTLAVNSSGVTRNNAVPDLVSPYSGLHYDTGTGLIYTNAGQVIDPIKGTTVGNYAAQLSYGSLAVPDSTLNRTFMLGQTAAQVGTSDFTLVSFDENGFQQVASMTIPNVAGKPVALIRWGSNGLAFVTRDGLPWDFIGIGPGDLYVITGSFVTQ